MEGNHDVDYMYGGPDHDDMIGGGAVAGRLDAGDFMYGNGGADFELGDNGTLTRVITAANQWLLYKEAGSTAAPNTTVVRNAVRFDVGGPAGTAGGDYMEGNAGDDHQYGQNGDDEMHGNAD